jgi:plastocyanin
VTFTGRCPVAFLLGPASGRQSRVPARLADACRKAPLGKRWRLLSALSAVAVLSAGAPRAQQPTAVGLIRGHVDVRRAAPQIERRPTVNELGAPRAHGQDVMRSVVYLESAPSPAFAELEPQRATLDQRNETFVPHVLAITVGTTVEFPNSDNTYHNVFSISKTRSFDLGHYAAGHSKSVRFDRPGIVRVFCEIHSHMSAFILVFSHRYFSVTSADGRYQIGRVPAGRYALDAWNEGEVRESRQVDVSSEGGTIEADFTLR